MAQHSSPGSELPPSPRRRSWRRMALATGGGLLLGLAGLGTWGYHWARREIPPFLQYHLTTALGRPLKVGEFERFSPTGVRLGPSIVPPTEDNFSWVRARALEVNFNPLELLFTRTLRPSVIFIDPQVSLKQGFDGDWRLQPPQSVGTDQFIRTELHSLQIRNADLVVGPISRTAIVELPEGVTSATLLLLEDVNLRVRFSGPNNQTAAFIVGGRLNDGAFQVQGEGQLDTREANLALRVQQLPIAAVNPLFGGSFFVRDGLVSTNLDLRLRPQEADPLTVQGTARLRNGDIVIAGLPSDLEAINGTLVLNGVGGTLENSSLRFGSILVRAEGDVDLHRGHNLAVTIPQVTLAQVSEALGYNPPVEAVGEFQVQAQVSGPLLEPEVAGSLANRGPVQVDRLGLGSAVAQFAASLAGFTLTQATLRPTTGGVVTAQGEASFAEGLAQPRLALTAQTDLPLDALAESYGVALPPAWRLGPLRAEAALAGPLADLRGEATWQLPQATFPGRGRLSYAQGLVQATDTRLRVGEGSLEATASANLGSRAWQAQAQGTDLALGLVAPQLRGRLAADLRASGSLNALTLEGVRAEGQARFSQAVPLQIDRLGLAEAARVDAAAVDRLLPGPLDTRFAWTGRRLAIAEAIAPGLRARGGVDVALGPGGAPQIGPFDLTAQLEDLDLAIAYDLLAGPDWLDPRGSLAFDGRLAGTLAAPRLAGTLGLRGIQVNALPLVNAVSGPVRVSAAGASLDLRGDDEQLAAQVAADLRPQSFRWARGTAAVTGQRQGHLLKTQLQNLDLGGLALRPLAQPDLGELGGILHAAADLDLSDLANPAASARFTLDRLALGAIEAQQLSGQVQYRDGLARLTDGSLRLTPTTALAITGSGRLFPQWQGEAEITTAGADFQDLLGVLRVYRYGDFGRLLNPPPLGRAADLAVSPVGDPQGTLSDRAALAIALRAAQAAIASGQAQALLPALDQLEGQVAGRLGVQAAAAGLRGDFELRGQNWAWGRYDFDNQFLARGRLLNRVVSLDPVEFRAGDTQLRLAGQVSAQDSNLAIAATALPLTAAATLVEAPVEVTGLLNLNAQLTGPYTNPSLLGQLAVEGATVNRQPLTAIDSQFRYQNAVFDVAGRVVGDNPEPLVFAGTIPYALPFMAVRPPTDQMALEASLKDDGFSLVNLFTPAIAWGGGQAALALRLTGTPARPLLSGAIAFDDAAFVSPWLGTSLDRLTGGLQFQGTQLTVESLTGNLFDGQFSLTGQIPLLRADATASDPGLRLALNALNLNYANEARTQIDGELTLDQALLAPVIGGEVGLQQTQVAVGQNLLRLANELQSQGTLGRLRGGLAQAAPQVPIAIEDLRLRLAPARVRALPLLSLDLEGDIALSGAVANLGADGAVRLTNGWVNTVTTEFFLEPSRANVVVFRRDDGLLPYLDLAFTGTVPLQRQYSINALATLNSTTGAAEIPSLDILGSTTVLDELQIEARFQGHARRPLQALSLTSTPPYGQDQLLGMVTGGYLAGLGGGEPGLALGSNLVGAFLADGQDAVARSLGLRRLRLVGSTVLPTSGKNTLGFGIGATVGITEGLSASLVQVLNQNQPLSLTARYRIDNNWSLGGSTDVNSQGRAFVEYRVNFP